MNICSRYLLLWLASVLLLFSTAYGGPEGWYTRGVASEPAMNLSGGPMLSEFPQQQGIVTNTHSEASPTLQSSPAPLSVGLQMTLPPAENVRIRELARGLNNDWRKCYGFVRDNIVYAPYFGFLRGPERTLLDREGNDADQSLLLFALLRASGYDVSIAYEPMLVSGNEIRNGFYMPLTDNADQFPYNAASWLDMPATGTVSTLYTQVSARLNAAGRPSGFLMVGGIPCVMTDHFWVLLTVGGVTYYLDPSFKPTIRTEGRNIVADMGYSRSSLLVSAGGYVGSCFVRSLSSTGISTRLGEYVAAVRSAWTNANATVSQFIGESAVARQEDGLFFHGYHASEAPYDFFCMDTSIREGFRALVTIKCGSVSKQFYLDELGVRHLWLAFENGASVFPKVSLRLDDSVLVGESTGSSISPVAMTLDIAYGPASMSATYPLSRNVSHVYTIPVGFGGDARGGMRSWATEELSKLRASGAASDDVRMIGRALQVSGQQWLSQTALADKLYNRITGGDHQLFYNIGIAGQNSAPFVDMRNSFGYSTRDPSLFDGRMLFSSALEHAVLDQLNGTNAPSVSTVKILELANASDTPVYWATASTYVTFKNALSGYSAAQKSAFQIAVNEGRTLLLPKNGDVTLNSWTGHGYVEHGPISNGVYSTGMVISGGMNGGFGTVDNVVDAVEYTLNTQPTTIYANGGVPETTQADPVAMPSGAFLDDKTDLLLRGGTPLSWTRHYDSRSRYDNGDLGPGWSHGFEAKVTQCTDADAAFGRSSLDAVIPAAVACAVVDDLLAEQTELAAGERARRLMVAALVVQWWTRQLVDASVSVNLGAHALMFQRRPDGSYAPHPGVTATLERSSGIYVLKERLGNTYRFNAAGRLASVIDPSGNATTLTYDTSGRLTRVNNAFGATFSVSWTGTHISRVQDGANRSVSYVYDDNGCLVGISDTRGKNWTASYDPTSHALLTKVDPEGHVLVRNTYNALGQVTNQISANGSSWTFGYTAGIGAWDSDPLGRRLVQSYTEEGRVSGRMERDGAFSEYRHDGHGHVIARTDPAGRTDFFHYDSRDNLIQIDEGVDGLRRISSFGYDTRDRLIAMTNALGQTTTYSYDSHDRLLKTVSHDGLVVSNTWNAKGLLSNERIMSPEGDVLRETIRTYSTRGLPLTMTVKGPGLPAVGTKVATYTYSSAGLPLTVKDANNHVTTFTYDAAGEILTIKAPDNGMTRHSYTDAGHLWTETDALGRVTTKTWTGSGKLSSILFPDGTCEAYSYDAVDELASSTDSRGAMVTFTRDSRGRVTARTTPSGSAHKVYNVLGLPVSETDATGVVTETRYDWLYRPVAVLDGLGEIWWTGYNPLDQVISTTDPRGKMRRFSFDVHGRQISSTRPSGATEHIVYDGLGNMLAVTNAEIRPYRMAYDALGRQLSTTDATGHLTVTNRYDGVGNLLERTDGNGTAIAFSYDVCDRLTQRSGPGFSESFAYDTVGNLVNASNDVARTSLAYDVHDRLVATTTRVADTDFPVAWIRDAGGLVTNLLYAQGKSIAYTYDEDRHLITVQDWLGHIWSFTYDESGRPTGGVSPDGIRHAFAYDAAGRLSGWNAGTLMGRTFTRDAAGRRVRDTVTAGPMPFSSSDRRAVNVFDAADRLVSASVTYGVTNLPVAEVYFYDGNGALTNATVNGDSFFDATYEAHGRVATLGAACAFAYDASGNRILSNGRLWVPNHVDPLKRPLQECSSDGTPIRYYIWGEGRLLGFIDAENGVTIAHSDERGSIIALTASDGTVLYMANYGPNGEDWGASGENPTPFAWLGGYGVQRISTGNSRLGPFYLTRHRLYSPTLRRFLSTDPLLLKGGLNLYAYGNGDPLAYIDPLGLCAGSAEVDFFENLAAGAVSGDFANDTGWGGTVGQIGVGFIPVVGQLADARDTIANLNNVWKEPSSIEAWTGFAMSVVAWAPGVGDMAKAAYKGGRKAIKIPGQILDRGSTQIKRLTNSEIQSLKNAGVDPHDLKVNSKYDLFKDSEGKIIVKPKSGVGPGEDTGLNILDFKGGVR